MPRRRIGQEHFSFVDQKVRGSLDEIHALIDWSRIEGQLRDIHAAARGEAAWPPLAMVKALLLAVWYDLSDVKLAEALDDRASFRRFCGFARHEQTPERTAFVRFRRQLVTHGLERSLFDEITAQLKAKAVTVKTGTLVDATVIASASQGDGEAGWSGHRNRKAIHGYKAHVAADADTALVEVVEVTPGNVHDSRAGSAVVPDDPGQVFADSAYRGTAFAGAVTAKGGTPRVASNAFWARESDHDAARRYMAMQKEIHRVRARIEKIFGTWKRSYGLRRMRWRGIAKCSLQVHLTAIAYNLKRALGILRMA